MTSTTEVRSERTSSFNKGEEPKPARLNGRPLGTAMIVKRLEVKQTGVLHSVSEQKSDEALVLTVGPAVVGVNDGDTVLLRRNAGVGTEIRYERQDYLIVDLVDVLLVIPN